ncbi:hypothetical protein 7S15_28 [uncultured Caudovirales phage]|uniref:YopX protein domain-containing protein n=1 Tax=uncultured Caudovirales phage TaxID=2100421 RepID=A0A2H4JHC7_9CAUD|nr:hypothetical protein 7S15_28 [uncultured Caudovirales phage]
MIAKYRFYNIKLNKIYEVVSIDWLNEQVDCILPEMNEDISNWDWNVGVLMQYTGLKDKNGVEIYEGDIIDKGYHNFSIKNRVGYVEFSQGGDSDGWAHGDWLGWITNNYDSLLDVHEHCTVLGNKYEHPYLLEE